MRREEFWYGTGPTTNPSSNDSCFPQPITSTSRMCMSFSDTTLHITATGRAPSFTTSPQQVGCRFRHITVTLTTRRFRHTTTQRHPPPAVLTVLTVHHSDARRQPFSLYITGRFSDPSSLSHPTVTLSPHRHTLPTPLHRPHPTSQPTPSPCSKLRDLVLFLFDPGLGTLKRRWMW